jgi:pimeloyl-ACP methyl ester carboxylesterase
VAELTARGVRSTAVELPLTGLEDDIRAARAVIEAAGPDAVVVGHSFGGLVISDAAAGVEPPPKRLIYLAAFMVDDPDEVAAVMAEHDAELLGALIFDGEHSRPDPGRAAELFYGDAPAQVAAEAVTQLRPQALTLAGNGGAAWRTVATTYVVCTADRALPPAAQEAMAKQADETVRWQTDHSPFLTRPADVAELICSYI